MQTIQTISTNGPGLYEFTDEAAAFVGAANIDEGLLTVFVRHTSCSLVIQENADPQVQTDLLEFFKRLVLDADDPAMEYLRHRSEGPDDMPAHIKAALTQTSLTIPVASGKMLLGIWQGLFLFEHRRRPHNRELVFHLGA